MICLYLIWNISFSSNILTADYSKGQFDAAQSEAAFNLRLLFEKLIGAQFEPITGPSEGGAQRSRVNLFHKVGLKLV